MTNFKMMTAALLVSGAALATSASAQSYFFNQMEIDGGQSFMIEGVTTEAAGVVAVFEYHGGERGEMLGMAEVNEGANTDVLVTLSREPSGDILAVLFAGSDTTGRGVTNTVIDVDDM